MRIVVLDGYTLNPSGDNPWDAVAALGDFTLYDRTNPADVVAHAKDADILISNKVVLDAKTVSQLPKLKFISVLATGYDVIDLATTGARGVPVSNVVAYGVDSVAQHVIALLMELCRGTGRHDASVKHGDWGKARDWCYSLTPQRQLTGMVMGIVGFGNNGRKVGELAHAFGMEVISFTKRPTNPPAYKPFRFVDLDTLFRESEVISLHCPLTDQTRHLVNAERIASMRDKAFIINTARGPLLNEEDVAAALHSGKLGGLGADVLTMEPPSPDTPLLTAPSTVITPHIAWATLHARRTIMAMTAENIQAFLAGRPRNVVNSAFLK